MWETCTLAQMQDFPWTCVARDAASTAVLVTEKRQASARFRQYTQRACGRVGKHDREGEKEWRPQDTTLVADPNLCAQFSEHLQGADIELDTKDDAKAWIPNRRNAKLNGPRCRLTGSVAGKAVSRSKRCREVCANHSGGALQTTWVS